MENDAKRKVSFNILMYLSRIPDIRGQLSQVKFPSTVLPFNTTTQPLKLIRIYAAFMLQSTCSDLSCALVGLSLQEEEEEEVLNQSRIRIQRRPAGASRLLNRSWRPSDLTGSLILNQSQMRPSKMIFF